MEREKANRLMHELDATVRVGKGGVEAVADELSTQLKNEDAVKVKFLRSSRTDNVEELAEELADEAGSGVEVATTRGHTALFVR